MIMGLWKWAANINLYCIQQTEPACVSVCVRVRVCFDPCVYVCVYMYSICLSVKVFLSAAIEF